jgi:hypothetical protein
VVRHVGHPARGHFLLTVVVIGGQPVLDGHTVLVVVVSVEHLIMGQLRMGSLGQGSGLVSVVVGQGQGRGTTAPSFATTKLFEVSSRKLSHRAIRNP